jgi:hypothetical protein
VGVGSTAEESAKAARKFENFGIQRSDLLIHFVERSSKAATGNPANADDLEAKLDRSARTVELLATDKIFVLQFETAGEPNTLAEALSLAELHRRTLPLVESTAPSNPRWSICACCISCWMRPRPTRCPMAARC